MTEFSKVFGDWSEVIDFPLLINTLNKLPVEGICPNVENVFNAFKLCTLQDCKVVFLGQDPYPQKGVATGILFGNSVDTKEENLSPSLQVIKESVIDPTIPHNRPIIFDNSLESWAKQGILMLNSALTVATDKIGSHTQIWRPFMAKFIQKLSNYGSFLFVLFGKQAQTFEPYINKTNCYIIKENHPAFYARSNKEMPSTVFNEVNKYLKENYRYTIKWYREFDEDEYGTE